jgi:glycosyltransferase involved in cell wall biosynthesis
MKLTIIIPVYNESETLENLLSLLESISLPFETEVLVIDDGSSDGSREIAAKHTSFKLICHEKNQGKGAAIRNGLRYASGDFICIQDADMEYLPSDLPALAAPLLEREGIAVFGTRFACKPAGMSFRNYVGNLALTLLCKALYRAPISDVMTGYKLFPRHTTSFGELDLANFGFEIEIVARILRLGYEIVEVPIHYFARTFGKKITWVDGLMSVYYLFKYRCGLKAPRLQFIHAILESTKRKRK